MKKRVLAVLLAGAMVFSLAACGGEKEEKKETSGVTVDGNALDADQHYNGYLASDPTTLDSVKGNDTYSWGILLNIVEPLTRMDQEGDKDVRVPAGAASWESNEDATVWTFKLNDNKWSDGQPVKAESVTC